LVNDNANLSDEVVIIAEQGSLRLRALESAEFSVSQAQWGASNPSSLLLRFTTPMTGSIKLSDNLLPERRCP
jgi:hypothetical protein